jgi:pilus assembly protein CpaF
MVVGEVGTGKTTLARALASSIPHDESVLVIEDTPEIRLDHPHVRYVSTREENIEGSGRVSPAQCIRAGMRMAMNRIIFGEIRDAEAAEAFVDVCASGHSGLSTLHARSALDAVTRLELFLARAQKNADRAILGAQVCTAVQVVAVVDVCKTTGVRRIMEVRELGPIADGVLRQREIFAYKITQGQPAWVVAGRVSSFRERLEQEPARFSFAGLGDLLTLSDDVVYREAATSMRR